MLAAGLVDELRLVIAPVVVGGSRRPFPPKRRPGVAATPERRLDARRADLLLIHSDYFFFAFLAPQAVASAGVVSWVSPF